MGANNNGASLGQAAPSKLRDLSMLWILVGVFILGSLLSGTFLKPNNIRNILLNSSIYGLIALGQSIVMLIREVDLSVGASLAFSPMLAVYFTSRAIPILQGGNYVIGGAIPIVVLTVLISVAIGLVNAFLVVRVRVPALITTMGMMYILQGLTYTLFGGYSLYLTQLEGFRWAGVTSIGILPLSFLLYLLIAAVVIFFVNQTPVGSKIYAIGGNGKAAKYAGIHNTKWRVLAFAFSGLCVGIAALLYCSRMESVETIQGSGYEMTAIAISVIGGTTMEGGRGKLENTFIASIILSMVLNLMSLKGLVSWYQTMFIGVIIVAAAIQHVYKYRRGDQAGIKGVG